MKEIHGTSGSIRRTPEPIDPDPAPSPITPAEVVRYFLARVGQVVTVGGKPMLITGADTRPGGPITVHITPATDLPPGFERQRDMHEVTNSIDISLGRRQFLAGPMHYRIAGQEVTAEEFARQVQAWHAAHPAPDAAH